MHPTQMDNGGGGEDSLSYIVTTYLKVMPVKLQTSPSTFKALMVELVVGCDRFLVVNIYRSPGVGIITFLDELSDMKEFLSTT